MAITRDSKFNLYLLPLTVALIFCQVSLAKAEEEPSSTDGVGIEEADTFTLDAFTIYGEQGTIDTATKLDLPVFETPQTITSVSRVQMDDFNLNTINQVLDYTPGVTVEEVETDRTYYTARGFDVVNFQYDGVGTPFIFGINLGQQDTAIYERVEVVKGAAGLITGVANPSATINYVRKRPTEDLQASSKITGNEWNGYRFDGDVSGNLLSNVRGRLVAAYGDTESYLDRYETETSVLYGIIEIDVTDSTLLTVGHSYNKDASDGILWGALPLVYSDNTPTNYDVSTSNAPDWTYRDVVENQTFVEFEQGLGERWSFNGMYMHKYQDSQSELFYTYNAPNRDETGLGASNGHYEQDVKQDVFDLFISGDFDLFNRQHQIVVGYNYADVDTGGLGRTDTDELPQFPATLGANWAQGNLPRPNSFETLQGTIDINTTYKSFYVSSRFNLTDRLSVLLGARNAEVEQSGISYGASQNMSADETVPYYGATFELTDTIMAYGSYSEVFTPQNFVDSSLNPLGPQDGDNTEIGLKKSFNDERTIATLAYFQGEFNNIGEFIGRNGNGVALYDPRDYTVKGFEVEIAGELLDGLNVSGGYTHLLELEDDNGSRVRPYVPDQLLKLSASYRIPQIPELKVGGVLKWQDDTTTATGIGEQEDYVTVDLAMQYDVLDNISLTVNLENVTDEKYYNSLYWEQAYYAAPRNVQASLRWEY